MPDPDPIVPPVAAAADSRLHRLMQRLRVWAVIIGVLVMATVVAGGLVWLLARAQAGRFTVLACGALGALALAHAAFHGRHPDRRPPWHAGAAVLAMAVAWFGVIEIGVERILGTLPEIHELASQRTWLLGAGCVLLAFVAAGTLSLATRLKRKAAVDPAPAEPPSA